MYNKFDYLEINGDDNVKLRAIELENGSLKDFLKLIASGAVEVWGNINSKPIKVDSDMFMVMAYNRPRYICPI